MARAMPPKEDLPEKAESSPDHPLLDLSDAAVKKLIRTAKKRGYVTHDQINSVLRSEAVNSEQMEDVLAMLGETGINVVEAEEAYRIGLLSCSLSRGSDKILHLHPRGVYRTEECA